MSQEEILPNSLQIKPRSFFDFFSFHIDFESEEVSMEKVVPLFKPLKTMFYLKNLELRKVLLG
jgi:hypothetical protein